MAQAVVLSAWHDVQGFGILYLSVIAGVMKANVCERTFTSAIVVAIFGMWQAMQLLPAEPFLVMCMLLESSRARAIHGKRPVTIQA